MGLAKALLMRECLDEALSELQRLNREELLAPETRGEFYKLIGIILDRKKDYEAAATFFLRYRDSEPEKLDPVVCLVRASLNGGDLDTCVTLLADATRRFRQRRTAVAILRLTRDLVKKGGVKLARPVFDAIHELHGTEIPIADGIVRLCLSGRNYAYAVLYAREVMSESPRFDRTRCAGLARVEALV